MLGGLGSSRNVQLVCATDLEKHHTIRGWSNSLKNLCSKEHGQIKKSSPEESKYYYLVVAPCTHISKSTITILSLSIPYVKRLPSIGF